MGAWLLALVLACVGFGLSSLQAETPVEPRNAYRIPAGDAAATLRRFATVSGVQIVYLVENVRGERTNGISGRFTAREALERMLAGTELNATQDEGSGALVVGRRRPVGTEAKRPAAEPPPSAEGKGVLRRVLGWIAGSGPDGERVPADLAEEDSGGNAPIALQAFEVNTARDVGYTAASALAGGRIESPLRETPSAVSVMTRQFLDDIAATSFSSAAEWAPNSLPAGDTVGGAGAEFGVNMRGLGSSFPSRNYFRWYISSDSYSTERLEFARGPNAILFGDSNPGGQPTTWSKQAHFNRRHSVQVRADSWGGYRVSADYNQPFAERLAVRVNLLHDRLGGWRDYDDAQRDGQHVAFTYKLGRNTQIRGEYEQGRYLRYAAAQTFVDQSSNWDRMTVFNGTDAPPTAGTGLARFNVNPNHDYLVYDPQVGSVVNWKGFYQTTGSNLTLIPEGRPLANFPAFPGYEYSNQPPDAFVDATFKTWTAYLEHRFSTGFMAQLAYNHQEQVREGNVRQWNVHRIDVNAVLPDGRPNPNLGRVFTDVNTNVLYRPNLLGDLRLSLAHRVQTAALRHNLSVVAGVRNDRYRPRDYRLARVGGAVPSGDNPTNVVFVRQYWDAPRNPGLYGPARPFASDGGEFRWIERAGQNERQRIQYNQIASATALFDGRLNVLLGYRYDVFDRKAQVRNQPQPDGTLNLVGPDGPGSWERIGVEIDTISAGAVWFPVPWIGPFINYSEGFNAPGGGPPAIDGTPLGTSTNAGIDVGLKLELFGGRISGSVGYYDSEQVQRPRAGDNVTLINQIWSELGRPERAIESYRDTESYRGRGFELDLAANPTPDWRLMFNFGAPRTSQAAIGPGLRGYVAANIAEWRAGAANADLPGAATVGQAIADVERTLQGYAEGRTLNGTADYTANVYATYTFPEGPLKGFAVGGGANFRGRQVIDNVNGQPYDYLYARPYTLVSAHVGYVRSIGSVRARFQLNVSNLFDERALVYSSYSYIEAAGRDFPNVFRHQNPRRFMLTTTFDF